MARPKKEEYVTVDITAGHMVYITDIPSVHDNNPPIIHHAKLLSYFDGILTMAFCVRKSQGLQYETGSGIAVSYVELKDNYMFQARILSVRPLRESDPFSVMEMGNFLDEDLYSYEAYDAYIVELGALTNIVKHQRRAYYRSGIGVDIYYKPISSAEAKENDPKLKFASQDRAEEKKKAEQGYYERTLGYNKLKTIDISAGGFKYLSSSIVRVQTHFDCMIMLEYEALPVISRVLACTPTGWDRDHSRIYQVRCCYEEINDAIRDRIMKFIFQQERKIQKRMTNR